MLRLRMGVREQSKCTGVVKYKFIIKPVGGCGCVGRLTPQARLCNRSPGAGIFKISRLNHPYNWFY